MSRAATTGGFTLVEIVIALVVMQIGLAAALGVLGHAERAMRRGEALERAAAVAGGLVDSLWSAAEVAEGGQERARIVARWVPFADGLRLEVVSEAGDTIRLEGSLSRGDAAPGEVAGGA